MPSRSQAQARLMNFVRATQKGKASAKGYPKVEEIAKEMQPSSVEHYMQRGSIDKDLPERVKKAMLDKFAKRKCCKPIVPVESPEEEREEDYFLKADKVKIKDKYKHMIKKRNKTAEEAFAQGFYKAAQANGLNEYQAGELLKQARIGDAGFKMPDFSKPKIPTLNSSISTVPTPPKPSVSDAIKTYKSPQVASDTLYKRFNLYSNPKINPELGEIDKQHPAAYPFISNFMDKLPMDEAIDPRRESVHDASFIGGIQNYKRNLSDPSKNNMESYLQQLDPQSRVEVLKGLQQFPGLRSEPDIEGQNQMLRDINEGYGKPNSTPSDSLKMLYDLIVRNQQGEQSLA